MLKSERNAWAESPSCESLGEAPSHVKAWGGAPSGAPGQRHQKIPPALYGRHKCITTARAIKFNPTHIVHPTVCRSLTKPAILRLEILPPVMFRLVADVPPLQGWQDSYESFTRPSRPGHRMAGLRPFWFRAALHRSLAIPAHCDSLLTCHAIQMLSGFLTPMCW